jgi:hypothetical protein
MKQLLNPANATFDKTAGTITFATTIPTTISHILHVTNVTRGVLYFQPQAGAAYTGTYASPVLTLAADTSAHNNADKLEIFYDDALTTQAITVATIPSHAVTNAGTFAVQATVSSLPLPSGAATETTLGGVLTTSDFDTKTGSLTETAPSTDTASSGLNGRLQRIAQRITSLISALGSPFQAGGSIGNTTFASTIADGADVTLGAKADAKSAATDTTAITIMSVLKQISSYLGSTLGVSQAAATIPTATTMQNAATATGNGTLLNVRGYAIAIVDVTISAAASVAFEISTDDSTWNAAFATIPGTVNTSLVTTSSTGSFIVHVSGYKSLRARISSYGSGTVTAVGSVSALASHGAGTVPINDAGGSVTVDNAGTFAVQATIASGATAIAKAEDVASANADVGVPAMAIQKATPADTAGTDGDYAMVQMSAGRLWVSAAIDTALPAGSAAIGKLAANSGVTIGAVEVAASQTVGTFEKPDATSTYAGTNATSSANETNRVVKGSAGVLFSITGYNAKTSAQFIQLHNASSLPADTAVPVITFTVPASSNFSLDFGGKFGRYFSTGIVVCNSSTQQTKTIGSADCWFDVQYA